jgi:hypothetical protein
MIITNPTSRCKDHRENQQTLELNRTSPRCRPAARMGIGIVGEEVARGDAAERVVTLADG